MTMMIDGLLKDVDDAVGHVGDVGIGEIGPIGVDDVAEEFQEAAGPVRLRPAAER